MRRIWKENSRGRPLIEQWVTPTMGGTLACGWHRDTLHSVPTTGSTDHLRLQFRTRPKSQRAALRAVSCQDGRGRLSLCPISPTTHILGCVYTHSPALPAKMNCNLEASGMAMRSMYSGSRYLIRSSTRKVARWKIKHSWEIELSSKVSLGSGHPWRELWMISWHPQCYIRRIYQVP